MPTQRRTRGCQSCIRRKIKCGLQIPHCYQCRSSHIHCSGPVLGPIILQFDPQRQRRPHAQTGRRKQCKPSQELLSPATLLDASPTLHLCSPHLVVLDTLASKFQEHVYIPHQRYSSIVSALVDLASTNDLRVLRNAIGAVSLALGSISTNNVILLQEAQKIYGASLGFLIRAISRCDKTNDIAAMRKEGHVISIELIAVTAISVWFEALRSTNSTGWVDHSLGAVKLVIARSPNEYTSGLAHAVFRTVRFMAANASLTTIQPISFALDPWLTIPFCSSGKTAFDELIDIVLFIPICLVSVDRMIAEGLQTVSHTEREATIERLTKVGMQLDLWWINYKESFAKIGVTKLYHDIESDREDSKGFYHAKKREYLSDEVAESLVYYELCRMLVALMKFSFLQLPDLTVYWAEALAHSASVLAGVAYLDTKTTTGGLREYFGLACPLLMTFMASPSEAHRIHAKSRMDRSAETFAFQRVCGYSPSQPLHCWRSLSMVWARPRYINESVSAASNRTGIAR